MGDFLGHCSICGFRGDFFKEEGAAARDTFRCQKCRSMLRQRDVAQIIIDEFGEGKFLDIGALVGSGMLDEKFIYEVGIRGPIADRLRGLPNYTASYFWEDVKPGDYRNGIICQDLRNLTFATQSFDVIISLELFEHILEPQRAIREIYRVLRPGGLHIFSVPVAYPLPDRSTVRAELFGEEIIHLEEPRYHVAGDLSKSLVVTDWGRDLVRLHADEGLKLSVIRRSAPYMPMLTNATMIARKPF